MCSSTPQRAEGLKSYDNVLTVRTKIPCSLLQGASIFSYAPKGHGGWHEIARDFPYFPGS
jgi:hypothetical protein